MIVDSKKYFIIEGKFHNLLLAISDYEFDTIKLHSQFKPNLNLHEEVTFNWIIQNFQRFQKLVRGKIIVWNLSVHAVNTQFCCNF